MLKIHELPRNYRPVLWMRQGDGKLQFRDIPGVPLRD